MTDQNLTTPIYLKTGGETSAHEKTYLLLAGNGLWICRNHEFFASSVPARRWPSELKHHGASLELRHPKIPARCLSLATAFFESVAALHAAEAGALLAWHLKKRRLRLLIPWQTATVSKSWRGRKFPIGLHYQTPTNLHPSLRIVGDIHSHVYDAACSSAQDRDDEKYRPGLHLVIGRLQDEPPQFHAEYVVDGRRFDVAPETVMEPFTGSADDFPRSWLDRLTVLLYDGAATTTYRGGCTKGVTTYQPRSGRDESDIASGNRRFHPQNGGNKNSNGLESEGEDTDGDSDVHRPGDPPA